MDTADLLAAAEQTIIETKRDRDRLIEAVSALDDEIHEQEGEAEVLARLIARFGNQAPANKDRTASRDTRPGPHEATIAWPSGAGFDRPIKTKKLKAWAKYKMEAADWYLDALVATKAESGRVTRVLGVEMAVEGAIQSLCSGFEVMICALTQAIEKAAGIPSDRRTPLRFVTWSRLAAAAKVFNIDLACSLSVSAALLGEHSEEPEGPLAQLFVLRSRAAIHDLLVDTSEQGGEGLHIEVPGRGPLPLVEYLLEARELVGELLETILHDVTDAKSGRLYISASNELRERAEHGLGAILAPDGLLAS